jgi:hypothetical protein
MVLAVDLSVQSMFYITAKIKHFSRNFAPMQCPVFVVCGLNKFIERLAHALNNFADSCSKRFSKRTRS